MAALIRRTVLNALASEEFLAEFSEKSTQEGIRAVVAQTGTGNYGQLLLTEEQAKTIQRAAEDLLTAGTASAALQAVLPDLAKLPAY